MKTLMFSVVAALCLAAAPPHPAPPIDFQSNHGPSIGYENINDNKPKEGKHPPALPVVPRYSSLKSSIKTCGERGCEGVELVSEVIWVPNHREYQYTYTIKNVGKKTLFIGSPLSDRAIGLSNEKLPTNLYKVKGGKSVTIKVSHKDPPVEQMSSIICYSKKSPHGIKEWHKERKVTITGSHFGLHFQMSGSCNGWLPKGLVPKGVK